MVRSKPAALLAALFAAFAFFSAGCSHVATKAAQDDEDLVAEEQDSADEPTKVDEADIGAVQLGQPARIRVETFKDQVFDGHVTKISPTGALQVSVTTFELRVYIDNPGKALKANNRLTVHVIGYQLRGSVGRARRASST